MLIREPGKVSDRIDFLGARDLCLYLLKGSEAMIIGGGMSSIAPSLEEQFAAINMDPGKIKYLVIPHSHFDHCGAVPYLKRKFPHVQVMASAHAQKIFSNEKAIRFIANANGQRIEKLGLQDEYQRLNLRFDGITVDRVVVENDIIDLGDGIEAHFVEVPGHTECCIAVYVPSLKAIFPTDAAPFPIDDEGELRNPSPQYDFSAYQESLKKLAAYDVEICAFEHNGVFVGEQARQILHKAVQHTENFKNYVIGEYRRTGDVDKLAREIVAESMKKGGDDLMSVELQTTVTKTVISKILRSVEE